MLTFGRAKDVAAEYHIAESTVFLLAAQNRIPHVRFGKRAIRFPMEEVRKWAEEQIRRPMNRVEE